MYPCVLAHTTGSAYNTARGLRQLAGLVGALYNVCHVTISRLQSEKCFPLASNILG